MERLRMCMVVLSVSCLTWEYGDSNCCLTIKQIKKDKSYYNATDVTDDFQISGESRIQPEDVEWKAPDRPRNLRLQRRTLVWESSDTWRLRNFLLKIKQDLVENGEPVTKTSYHLLGPFKVKTRAVFYYNCTRIMAHTEKVKFTLWPLGIIEYNGPENGSRIYKTGRENHASLTWKPEDRRSIIARKAMEECVCGAKILRIVLASIDNSTLHSVTMVENNRASFPIEFYLNRNGEDVDKWREETVSNENFSQIRRSFPAGPGRYVLKARKICPGEAEKLLFLKCNRIPSDIVPSEPFTFFNASIDVNVLSVPMPYRLRSILPVIVGSLAAGGLALAVVLITLIKLRNRKKMNDALESPAVNTSLLTRGLNTDEPVAVIYVNESPVHRSRVYNLVAILKSRGIDAFAIDEFTRTKEMVENWISEGERVSNTYNHFLFVLSSSLVDACRTSGNARHPTGSTFRESTPPVGHSKLPLVILNSIKPRALHFDTKNLQTVCFTDGLIETVRVAEELCRDFSNSNKSIVHCAPFKLEVKDQTIVRNETLAKLMNSFNSRQSVIKLCSSNSGEVTV